MLNVTERSRSLKILSMLCLLLGLAGCATKPVTTPVPAAPVELGDAPQSPDHYQRQAATAQGETRLRWQLLAARAYLNQGTYSQAEQLLQRLSGQLTPTADVQLEYQLLSATLLSQQGQFQQALSRLKPDTQWQLAPRHWQQFFQLQAELHFKLEHPIDAAIALMNRESYLEDAQAKQNNHKVIWFYLSQSDPDTLARRQSSADDFGGWKSLRLLTFQHGMDPDRLVSELKRWQSNFSRHPAAGDLPSNLTLAMTLEPYQPQKVALLLPLSGRFARSGRALRNGLITSMMAKASDTELMVLDTQELGAAAAYQQALAEGAEFVVGPLLKPDVEAIIPLIDQVPTLVLNVPETLPESGRQQYFFALDKMSEAAQAAERIFRQGKRQPAVIAPQTPQGHKLAQYFADHWQKLMFEEPEPTESTSFFFAQDSELKKTVERLFEVEQSQARITEMRYLLTNKLKGETRNRRDIDAVYLIASPRQTRLLKPFVDVAVSQFAPAVSVYVGPNGNDNSDNQQDNRDVNQLNVSEIPWLLNQIQPIAASEVKQLWPELSQPQLRLYAMGYDAFDLIGKLAQMELFPEYKLRGLSGELSLDEESKIVRKLNWAQYQRGKLLPQ